MRSPLRDTHSEKPRDVNQTMATVMEHTPPVTAETVHVQQLKTDAA